MGDDSFNRFRLSFMQDILPVGFAMADRLRRGGASKVVEAFTSTKDPLDELRVEGESAAKNFRQRLDDMSPGLGNPVMEVSVAVDNVQNSEIQDVEALRDLLQSIEGRLDTLKKILDDNPLDHLDSLDKES